MKHFYSLLLPIIILCILISSAALFSAPIRPFGLDQPEIEKNLNDYWVIYGLSEGDIWRNGAKPAISNQTDALEWMAIKAAWTSHSIRSQLIDLIKNTRINGINTKGKQSDGYVWADADNEAWRGKYYHYDQMPRYICAVCELWKWTRDRNFLNSILPSAEAVMDYMLKSMDGTSGIVNCPGDANGLSDKGKPSTYMDCYREGYQVAWINEGFYSALLAMKDMERVAGHRDKSAYYQKLSTLCSIEFNKVFWSDTSGRYTGWKDSSGKVHDYGFTYLNLEALVRGLGDANKAFKILNWLDNGKAQQTMKGGHKGSTDIYQLVVAPRTNTLRVADKDWDSWSLLERPILGKFYKYAYGAITRDGGTMLWYNYYDVMARLRWLDADSAWKHLTSMLNRCGGDERFLSFGIQGVSFRAYDMYDEHFLQIGSSDNYQSSGISALSVLHGFMGVRPTDSGLKVMPNLPSSISRITCTGIVYGNKTYDVTVVRTDLQKPVKLKAINTGTDSIVFSSQKTFNGLNISTSKAINGKTKLVLEKKMGNNWQTVASHEYELTDKVHTINFITADQPAGTYRLLQDKSEQVLKIDNLNGCCSIYEITSPQASFKQQIDAGNWVNIGIED